MGGQLSSCRCVGQGGADPDDEDADCPPAMAWASEASPKPAAVASTAGASPKPAAVPADEAGGPPPPLASGGEEKRLPAPLERETPAAPKAQPAVVESAAGLGPAAAPSPAKKVERKKGSAATKAAGEAKEGPPGRRKNKPVVAGDVKAKSEVARSSMDAVVKAPPATEDTDAPSESCPGMQMVAKVEKKQKQKLTPLQKIKKQKEEEAKRALEMRGLVDDILAGKFEKKGGGGGQPKGDMRIYLPSPYERENTRKMMLEGFRVEYRKMPSQKAEDTDGYEPTTGPDQKVSQYNEKEIQGLTIQGGHRPIPRPKNVDLPRDFRKPVGLMPLKTLKEHDSSSKRKLISVYGDIFDVSDRPDKYGSNGPYEWMTGNDVTWGFVSGKDTPDEINKFYDMWKIAPKEFQEKKLQGLLAWVAFYEYEYGGAVGRLQEYKQEAGLKGPPMEESEECCIM